MTNSIKRAGPEPAKLFQKDSPICDTRFMSNGIIEPALRQQKISYHAYAYMIR